MFIMLLFGYDISSFHLKSRQDTIIRCAIYGYSYDTNWDGYESFVYSYFSDDDPLSYPMKVGIDRDGWDEWSRGHVQFDVSGIPDSVTILSAGIQFLLAYDGQWEDEWDWRGTWIELLDMSTDQTPWTPSNGDYNDYTLYDDAGTGHVYAESLYMEMDPVYNTPYPSESTFIMLDSAGIANLQNALQQDWFGIGIHRIGEEGDGGNNPDVDEGVNFFGEETYLYVSYLPPDNPTLSNPVFSPDTDTAGSYFTFTIDYNDPWGYSPDTIQCILNDTIIINLDLLSGFSYDGTYGKKIRLNHPGIYNHYYYTRNTFGTTVYYPSDAPLNKINGPYVTYPTGIQEETASPGKYMLIDITGRVIGVFTRYDKKNVIGDLKPGIYFLRKGTTIKKIEVIK